MTVSIEEKFIFNLECKGVLLTPADKHEVEEILQELKSYRHELIEQQSLEFVTYTLMPWLNRIEKAIKRDLIDPKERSSISIKFNVAALLRGDASARSKYMHAGILDGWLTRNEARAMESQIGIILNPLDGLDVPLIPLNMADGSDDPDENEDEAEGEKPGGAEPAKETEDSNAKLIDAIRNLDIKTTVNVPPPVNHITVDTAPRAPRPSAIKFLTDSNGEITGAESIFEE